MAKREIKHIPPASILVHPQMNPAADSHLLDLMEKAKNDSIAVYFGAVPLSAIVPFDKSYLPNTFPPFEAAIVAVTNDWRHGRFHYIWVYQAGHQFVMSDDYVTYAAALRGQPDYLPCWILGKPQHDAVKDVQGPLDASAVRRALGFVDSDEE